jgi:hypothetical protein
MNWADLGSFGQFRAVLGSLGQFWAEFAALTVAEILKTSYLLNRKSKFGM